MTAFWDTAVWDVDRWATVALSDLIMERPSGAGVGALIGAGDWRIRVEVLFPASTIGDLATPSLWGFGEWDEANWEVLEWFDVTGDVRGLSVKRGADEPYGRPRVGQCSFDLNSHDDRWSPLNTDPPNGVASFFAPGTLVRVGVVSATDSRAGGWIPLFTGEVDSWVQRFAEGGKDRVAEIQAFETVGRLARFESAAVSPVGAGEDAVDRFDRLLTDADWPYGFVTDPDLPSIIIDDSVAATDLSGNRLSEIYIVADSTDTSFRSDRYGRAFVYGVEYNTSGFNSVETWPLLDFSETSGTPSIGFWKNSSTSGDFQFLPYEPDSLKFTNDDYHIVNDVRLNTAGGATQTAEQSASIERFGHRTYERTDLINQSESRIEQIAQFITLRRGLNTLRVDNVTVDCNALAAAASSDEIAVTQFLAALATDVGLLTFAYLPEDTTTVYITGYVASVRHDVSPSSNGLRWKVSYSIDTRTVTGLPAAQLPNDYA